MTTPLSVADSQALTIRSGEPELDGSREPKYEQLRRRIIQQIAQGVLKPGDALQTERWWAEQHQLSRSTVRQAMSSLERDGVILRIQGKGTFIHDRANRLSSRHLAAFALVVPETQTGFYPSLQRSFDAAAGDAHHQMLVCSTGNNLDRQGNIILQLLDTQVSGVALVPVTLPSTPAYQLRQLQKAGIPLVCCHRRVDGVKTPLVAIPFHELGLRVASAFVEAGHRSVAFFSPQRTAASMSYESGLRDGLSAGGAQVAEGCVYYGADAFLNPADYESEITEALEAMLSRPDRPTAIFASFDSLAELIYLVLCRMGFRVPDEISVVGLGGVSRTSPMMRRLTSATVDELEIGRKAAQLLEQMSRGDRALDDSSVHVVRTGIYKGQTLGPAPGL